MEVPLLDKLNRPLPWILGLMVGGVLVVGGMTYKLIETPSAQTELEKMTVPATKETLAVEIKASGTVEPILSVNISPKNPGRLVQLLVEQGMRVKQGQRLAVMENGEVFAQGMQTQAKLQEAIANLKGAQARIPEEIKQLDAEVRQSKTRIFQTQSQVAAAQARLKQAQARIPKEIEQAQSQLRSADARFRLAQARVERNQSLMQEGAIAKDRFDEVAKDYLDAQANIQEALQRLQQSQNTAPPEIAQIQQEILQLQGSVSEAQINLQETKSALEQRQNTAPAEIAQLRAAAAAAQADLERAKIDYKDTVITAPFDGVITQRYTTVGAFVTPTTSASSTASATSSSILALARGLKVVAKVPEVDVSLLRPGQPVDIVADAYPNEVFQGRVIRIAPEAIVENNVTSFEVTIGLVTGENKLLSKMNVDVNFTGQQISNALVVPTVAIVTKEGKQGVMIPDAEQKPKFNPVTIGLVLDDKTQILDGLTPGQKVFIDLPEDEKQKQDEKK